MIIGVPKEIKNNEYRVGLTPKSVYEITSKGHDVFIEDNAGNEIGYTNQNYVDNGAKIINSAEEVYKSSELIVKVKEPLSKEFKFITKDNILYKCGWSPFEGETFNCKITHTFVNGHLAYANGNFNESQRGMRLTFDR